MLPSMPILFTRDSQDAFGNKITPSTSYSKENCELKPAIKSEKHFINEGDKSQTILQIQRDNKASAIKTNELQKQKIVDNPLESALVKSYYTKVQSKLTSSSSVPNKKKFIQFQEALKYFDPSKETPVDLYRKIELIFGEDHKDLVEEFLLFLKPGQAADVGRFMDHFMLIHITGFIRLLQTTLSRKPTVLRKILRAISTGINTGKREEMKNRVLPHLRSTPHLTLMFKSLFRDERPPDSLYSTGTDNINESFLTNDSGYEVWEFEESDNKRKPDVKERLDSEYLHGRVFLQHGRLLRTACVTYPYSKEPYRSHVRRLAPDHCLSPLESDTERSSPRRNSKSINKIPPKRIRKLKSPTKNVKDVNDNTKKDCHLQALNKVKGKTHTKAKNPKKDDQKKKDKVDNKNACTKKEDIKAKHSKIDVSKGENKNWTREEDKTMLQVMKGGPGSEAMFKRIKLLLPHRTPTEIKVRFHHVMNLLQQMAVSQIT